MSALSGGEAFPNPWKKLEEDEEDEEEAKKPTADAETDVFYFQEPPETIKLVRDVSDADSQRGLLFSLEGFSDEEDRVCSSSPRKLLHTSYVMCCPCLVGHPCSKEKRVEYKRASKTFALSISTIQVIMMIVCLSIGGFENVLVNPMLGPPLSTLVLLGAKDVPHIRDRHQYWRLVSPIFLHAGLVHLLVNVFTQLRMGLFLERRWAWFKTSVIYFLSGIGGVMLSCVLSPAVASVGASGALVGMVGAYLMEIVFSWHKMESRQRKLALLQTCLFLFSIMLLSLAPYVDASGHFGGFIVGMLCGCIFFASQLPAEHASTIKWLPIAALVVTALLFIALLALIMFL